MRVSLRRLLVDGRLRRQKSGRAEVQRLFQVAERDLVDACVEGLSADRRFATAYNAALQLATIVLRSEGYRTAGAGHHATVIESLRAIIGPDVHEAADYLDACRSKRNTVDYDGIGIATEAEVVELVAEARMLQTMVRNWLAEHHPDLAE
jgi:uncharacterized protein (UPF0332 family)